MVSFNVLICVAAVLMIGVAVGLLLWGEAGSPYVPVGLAVAAVAILNLRRRLVDLLERRFGAADPTQTWVPTPGLVLDFDLDRHTLGHLRLGDPIDAAATLGPPDNDRPMRHGYCAYHARGFEVSFRDARICAFSLILKPSSIDANYQAFAGRFLRAGRPVALDVPLERFIRAVGEPYWRDVDEDGALLFYEFGDIEWQVEFDAHSGPHMFQVLTPPALASESERRAYKVTKAWPGM